MRNVLQGSIIGLMGKRNEPVTTIAVQCVANRLSSAVHKRGWLLGIERTDPLKSALEIAGQMWVTAALGDRPHFDQALERVDKEVPGLLHDHESEPEGPAVVSTVSIETLNTFLSLGGDPDDVVQFAKTSGVFRLEDTRPDAGRPRFVLDFWRETVSDGGVPVAFSLDEFWSARDRLATALNLYSALRSGKRAGREEAKRLADQLNHPVPEVALSAEMFIQLRYAKVGVDFVGPRATPVISTRHVLPGLYALLWQGFLRQTPLARCRLCSSVFAVTRKTKEFCREGCANAFKQTRYREAVEEAKRLRANGRTHRQIASSMGRDVDRIRKWVDPPGKQPVARGGGRGRTRRQ